MVRLTAIPEKLRATLASLPCPVFENTPWKPAPPLSRSRIALVSTAGLHGRGDRPFTGAADLYRAVPDDISPKDLVMSHVSTNFDRSGFSEDINVVFPLQRLHELVEEGVAGSSASEHYSFMGAAAPETMEAAVAEIAPSMKRDGVDVVLLVPV